MMGLETRCGKGAAAPHISQAKKGVQGEEGSSSWVGCPGHSSPTAEPLGLVPATPLKMQRDTVLRLCCSPCISSVSQRGTNPELQMDLFNPRLRRLIATFIQHLYQRAGSAVFQTSNFLWNRCEKQRQHSDPGFCFTFRTESVSHVPSLLWHWCSSSFLLTLQIPVTSLPDTTFHSGMHWMEIALSCHGVQEISFSLHQTPAPNSGWGIWP